MLKCDDLSTEDGKQLEAVLAGYQRCLGNAHNMKRKLTRWLLAAVFFAAGVC